VIINDQPNRDNLFVIGVLISNWNFPFMYKGPWMRVHNRKGDIVRAFCRNAIVQCDWQARSRVVAISFEKRSSRARPISGRLPFGNVTYLRRSVSIMNWCNVRAYADSVDKSSTRRGMFALDAKAWGTTHWRNGKLNDIISSSILARYTIHWQRIIYKERCIGTLVANISNLE